MVVTCSVRSVCRARTTSKGRTMTNRFSFTAALVASTAIGASAASAHHPGIGGIGGAGGLSRMPRRRHGIRRSRGLWFGLP